MFGYFFIVIIFLVAFFYLFVCVDGNKPGLLATIKNFLFETFPTALVRGGRMTCGDRFVETVERILHYICFETNPIVMILYLMLAIIGFLIYIRDGFSMLPGPYASEIHKYTGTALMLWCYRSYYLACTVNPGYIVKSTHKDALRRFKFENIMYFAKKDCQTCKFEKPARSKHCSLCDMCVEKMDHHCVWINQCVGLKNYKHFLSFLILHAVLCTYGFILGCAILNGEVVNKNLRNITFTTGTGDRFEGSWFVIF